MTVSSALTASTFSPLPVSRNSYSWQTGINRLTREIDRAVAAGVRFGCVLADAGYGLSAPLRQGLKLTWAVGHLKVYPVDVQMVWPIAKHLPGEEAWLIGEQRMSGEKKCYLANLPVKADLRTLAATIKDDGFASGLTSS